MHLSGYLIVITAWITWMTPFFIAKFNVPKNPTPSETSQANPSDPPARIDRRARWGVLLQSLAFAIQWQGKFRLHEPRLWQWILSAVFLLLASILSWTSALTLGRHWRIDAGLRADHQLVQSGAYSIVRHPIYTSMLSLLIGTGFLIASWPLFLISVIVFQIGTQIRVTLEEALLAARFGEEFHQYQKRVGAYLPFI